MRPRRATRKPRFLQGCGCSIPVPREGPWKEEAGARLAGHLCSRVYPFITEVRCAQNRCMSYSLGPVWRSPCPCDGLPHRRLFLSWGWFSPPLSLPLHLETQGHVSVLSLSVSHPLPRLPPLCAVSPCLPPLQGGSPFPAAPFPGLASPAHSPAGLAPPGISPPLQLSCHCPRSARPKHPGSFSGPSCLRTSAHLGTRGQAPASLNLFHLPSNSRLAATYTP